MAAHDLVCNEIRRRIGNGKSTLIWGHPWLPDDPSPMVQTPMPAHLNGSLVSGLMDEQTNSWDLAILSDIFLPIDVLGISKLPVSPSYEDTWFWHGEDRGCYTIKSGYRLIVGEFDYSSNGFDHWSPFGKLKCLPNGKPSYGELSTISSL